MQIIYAVCQERIHKFLALSFAASLIVSINSNFTRAQEIQREVLATPMTAPTDSGAYFELNRLPESLRRSMPFARYFHEYIEHAGTSGTFDRAAWFSAFDQAREDMLNSSRLALKGTSPQSIISGQWSNLGLYGIGGDSTPSAGITTAIVFDPHNPAIMYAGGSGGGVWKSLDTGANWFALTDNSFPNLSVASIAVDPVNPDTLYVGTGYCYNSTPVYSGSGFYQSLDSGQTWNRLAGGLDSGSYVKALVDPSKHNIVFASSFDKDIVYRSTDFGSTWKSVLSKGIAYDIIATPGSTPNTSVFYAICGNAGTNGGVYKSTDDGADWTKITSNTNFYTANSIGRCALASPLNAPNKIFALMTNTSGSVSELYESTDAGTSWNSINVPADVFVIANYNNYPQGWYDLYISVTPNSILSDTIYIGGVIGYVMRGTGQQWNEFSDYNHADGGGGYTHVDHHSFAISPVNSNIVYDGDDGGLWVNYAAGSNSITTGGWTLHSHGMVSNRFYHIGFDRSDTGITWAGAQDQGMWELDNGHAPTQHAPLGDAMQPIISPTNSNIKYAEGVEGLLYKSTQIPENWPQEQLSPDTAIGLDDGTNWDAPFKMSPVALGTKIPAASIIYLGRQHLWQSSDAGKSWNKLSPSFSNCNAIGLAAWDPNLVYASGGQFEMSTNFGVNWTSRANPGGTVTTINTSRQDTKFILVSISGSNNKLMMSDDSGGHWTNVSGVTGSSIPGAGISNTCNVMSVALDSISPLTTWYAATDFGMYSTIDAGQHWTFMGPGLFPCRDVQIAPNGTTLRVATYGRGIWEYNAPTSGVEMTSLSATKAANGTALAWYVVGEPAGVIFSVERSIDGQSYQSIESKDGIGASLARLDYSYTDPVTAPGTYLYRIHEIDPDGSERYSNSVELHYGGDKIYVYQPYPNPFIPNGSSEETISYELPARDNALVRIYNMTGVLVRTLQDGPLDGGPHTAIWDGRNSDGNIVASGAYIVSIETGQSGTLDSKIVVMEQ